MGAPPVHASHQMRCGHLAQFCQWGTGEVLGVGFPAKIFSGFLFSCLWTPHITCVRGYGGWEHRSQAGGQMSNTEVGKEETWLSLSLMNPKTVLTLDFLFT